MRLIDADKFIADNFPGNYEYNENDSASITCTKTIVRALLEAIEEAPTVNVED